jgi:hypothetical protein
VSGGVGALLWQEAAGVLVGHSLGQWGGSSLAVLQGSGLVGQWPSGPRDGGLAGQQVVTWWVCRPASSSLAFLWGRGLAGW